MRSFGKVVRRCLPAAAKQQLGVSGEDPFPDRRIETVKRRGDGRAIEFRPNRRGLDEYPCPRLALLPVD